jgi:single-strand DNA-binding protein
MSMNTVILSGNLTRDVELRHTQGNKAVANLGLAVNNTYKAADGTVKEDTAFVDCEAWGNTAEAMAKFLSKGRPVAIEGRLRMDTWQDKESGQNRSKLKVVIERFHFMDKKPDGAGADTAPAKATAPSPGGQNKPAPVTAAQRKVMAGMVGGKGDDAYVPIDDSDLPF